MNNIFEGAMQAPSTPYENNFVLGFPPKPGLRAPARGPLTNPRARTGVPGPWSRKVAVPACAGHLLRCADKERLIKKPASAQSLINFGQISAMERTRGKPCKGRSRVVATLRACPPKQRAQRGEGWVGFEGAQAPQARSPEVLAKTPLGKNILVLKVSTKKSKIKQKIKS